MLTWKPTDVFLRGIIVKTFLPFEKYPRVNDDNLKSLYPGDEVYIFEITSNNKWGRGYAVTLPFPNDFCITSVKLDEIPTQNISASVFPMNCVKILEKIPFSSEVHKAKTHALDTSKSVEMRMPLFPIKAVNETNCFIKVIKDAIELLTSHIFTFYSIGKFHLFYELSLIYYDLYELRFKLLHDILTLRETKMAKSSVIHLLNKIPKVLASEYEGLSFLLNGSSKENIDTYGYNAILPRDILTGDLLSYSNSIPLKIAFDQLLCCLPPENLTNMHLEEPGFTLTTKSKKIYSQKLQYDVLLDLKSFQACSNSHSTTYIGIIIYFYICCNRDRITETFAVRVNHPSSKNDLETMNTALFKNLLLNENSGNVYLVAQVVEEIDLSVRGLNKNSLLDKSRQRVAVGVADISKLFSNEAMESSYENLVHMQLFEPSIDPVVEFEHDQVDNGVENGWGKMVDIIPEGPDTDNTFSLKFKGLAVSLRCIKHQFELDMNSTLNRIPNIPPIHFYPLGEYECLYLIMGEISLVENAQKNALLTMKVSAPEGDLVFGNGSENCVRDWQFVSTGTNKYIGEILRINGFSPESVKRHGYVLFSLYVNGELTAESTFLFKTGSGLILNDTENCSIELFSIIDNSTIANIHISTFYVGKVLNSDINVNNVLQYEDYFKNGDMGIRQLLTKLVEFHQIELHQLVRYFDELLKALFSIADISTKQPQSETQQSLKSSTFSAIVYMLDTVFKNDSFSYLVAIFTGRNTCLPPIGTFIMENISKILFQAETNWTTTSIRVCRIVSILMNFAIKSDNSPDLDEYLKTLGNISESGAYFLSLKSDSYIDSQVLIIGSLHDILSDDINIDDIETMKLIVIFIDSIGVKGLGIDDVLYITNKVYISNKNSKTENAHRVIISKLLLIHRLFFTKIIEEPITCKILLTKSVEWAMEVLQGQTDVAASRIACSILNCVCTLLWKVATKENQEEITLCHSLGKLLPSISRAIIKYERFTRENGFYKPKHKFGLLFPSEYPFIEAPVDPIIKEEVLVEIQVELSTIFCFIARIGKTVSGDGGFEAILRAENEADFFDSSKYLLDDFQSKDLIDLLFAVNIIRRGKFIPNSKWLSLYSLLIEGCVVSLELIKPLLHAYFIPSFESQRNFNIIIWGNFLKSLLQLAVATPISIEYLPKTPKQACYQITGEIRDKIASMLYESWNLLGMDTDEEVFKTFHISRLGGYQMKFINTQYCVLHDLMLFALQNNSECQAVAAKLLWSITVTYFIEKKSIIDVERQSLLGLRDIYYNNVYKPGSLEQQKFMEGLKQIITVGCESEAIEVFKKFIESLEGFLIALNEHTCIPIGPGFDEDRTIHELKINAYLKNANKPELFDSLINTIYEKNIEKKDYIQAALTMELLASTYSWDQNTILRASLRPKFQRQTSFERKETLFNIIAKNFIKGNNLERALETYNGLLDSYRLHTYDLKRFANVHTKIANLYKSMATSDNLSSSYFRVTYVGMGFPPSVNGIIQIFEGRPFERIKSFHNRMLELHPGARIIPDHWEALKLTQSSRSGKYLHISSVEPDAEISGKSINATFGERKYAKNKELRYFSLIRKLGDTKSIYDLWTEEITYETNLRFPTILNKSDVRDIQVVKLSPLDNAVRTIEHKYNDLAQVEAKLINAFKEKSEYSSLLKDLRALLAGVVDSPVNGGVEQYRRFMYDDEYGDDQKRMKNAFDKLCVILDKCLQIHSKLVTPDMESFHDALLQLFKKNFTEEIKRLKLSGEHLSAYNHNYYQSLTFFKTELHLTLSSDETGVSSSASNISFFDLSSLKLSMRASKLFNWKKLRSQR